MNLHTLVLALSIIIIISIYRKYNKKPEHRFALPNILTMSGLAFTFLGIILGLFFFDSNDIQKSVPKLLDGLKISFISSCLGLALALWVRFKNLKNQDEDSEHEGATIDTLAYGTKKTNSLLEDLIYNNSESQKELIESFNEFARTQAENNSKTLIQALEEVMRDFNAKINEQFGDNFKQLNSAVSKLLEWQENYYKQIEFITKQIEQSSNSISKNDEILKSLTEKFKSIVNISEKFEKLIVELNSQRDNLQDNLSVFSGLSNDMKSIFPSIEKNIQNLTENFSEVVKTTNTSIQELVTDVNSQIKNNTQEILDQHRESQERTDSIQKDISNNMIEQLQTIEKGLEDELNNALTGLGSGLIAISNKLVEDYEKLSESIERVRNIENQLNN